MAQRLQEVPWRGAPEDRGTDSGGAPYSGESGAARGACSHWVREGLPFTPPKRTEGELGGRVQEGCGDERLPVERWRREFTQWAAPPSSWPEAARMDNSMTLTSGRGVIRGGWSPSPSTNARKSMGDTRSGRNRAPNRFGLTSSDAQGTRLGQNGSKTSVGSSET